MALEVPAIEVIDLVKSFDGRRAVDGLSLRVEHGQIFGFLGPNGAGKSTTLKILTGQLAPTSGSVKVLGIDVAKDPIAVRRIVGVVPEEPALFERLSALEHLAFAGRVHGLAERDVAVRAKELIDLVGLGEAAARSVNGYSHGMRKRLHMALALIHNPDVLFLDEPFEGMDAVAAKSLRDLLIRLAGRGKTVFLTSHVLDIVERLCARVGIIARGKILMEGTMGELVAGGSLEDLFLKLVGSPAERDIAWLA